MAAKNRKGLGQATTSDVLEKPSPERGKKLFFDKKVNCAQCHSGPYYTDSSLTKPFKLHDIGTGSDDPLVVWDRGGEVAKELWSEAAGA